MSAQDILRSFAEARDDDNLSIRDGITYGTAREIMRAIDAALARAEKAEAERDTLVLAMGEMGGRLMDAEDHAVCNLCHCCNDAPAAHEESLADWVMRAHVAEEARRVVTVRAEAVEKRIKEGTEAWGVAWGDEHRFVSVEANKADADRRRWLECPLPPGMALTVRRVLILDDPEPEATP